MSVSADDKPTVCHCVTIAITESTRQKPICLLQNNRPAQIDSYVTIDLKKNKFTWNV